MLGQYWDFWKFWKICIAWEISFTFNFHVSGKIGYGTASEALGYKLPFVFVHRDHFSEGPYLKYLLEVLVFVDPCGLFEHPASVHSLCNSNRCMHATMQQYQCGVEMTRTDLLTGVWEPYINHAMDLKPCYDGGINGGEVCLFYSLWSEKPANQGTMST